MTATGMVITGAAVVDITLILTHTRAAELIMDTATAVEALQTAATAPEHCLATSGQPMTTT